MKLVLHWERKRERERETIGERERERERERESIEDGGEERIIITTSIYARVAGL